MDFYKYCDNAGHAFQGFKMDCIAGMKKHLQPGSIDVIVTSPPYNIGVRYNSYNDTIERDKYLEWLDEWAIVIGQYLSPKGSLFLNIGSKPLDPLIPFQVLQVMNKYFKLQNVIHWIKSISIQQEDIGNYPNCTGNISVGHYKPINSPRFLNDCHEYIFHFSFNGDVSIDRLAIGVEYQDKSNIKRWNGNGKSDLKEDLRCRGNTWFVPYKTIKNRDNQRPHPATFPVKIPQMCIQLHGIKNANLVVDPFLGIGNSAIACIKLGVDFVGFEIDNHYFNESEKSIKSIIKPPSSTLQNPIIFS